MSSVALNQIMVLGDGPADFDDRRFLERIGADDGGRRPGPVMAMIGHGIHLGVGEAGDEVGGAGAAGGDADADPAGAARVALGREAAALLVPRQDRANLVGNAVSAWCIGMLAPPG